MKKSCLLTFIVALASVVSAQNYFNYTGGAIDWTNVVANYDGITGSAITHTGVYESKIAGISKDFTIDTSFSYAGTKNSWDYFLISDNATLTFAKPFTITGNGVIASMELRGGNVVFKDTVSASGSVQDVGLWLCSYTEKSDYTVAGGKGSSVEFQKNAYLKYVHVFDNSVIKANGGDVEIEAYALRKTNSSNLGKLVLSGNDITLKELFVNNADKSGSIYVEFATDSAETITIGTAGRANPSPDCIVDFAFSGMGMGDKISINKASVALLESKLLIDGVDVSLLIEEGLIKDMSTDTNFVYTKIPEPAEWAMFFGVVALGFVIYRRRK